MVALQEWMRALLPAALGLAGAWTAQAAPGPLLAPLVAQGPAPPAPWRVAGLPVQRKPYTRFDVVEIDGERALRVEADRSYGNLVHPTPLAGDASGLLLRWRWRLDEALPRADLRTRRTEDVPLRVCALFDLPLEAVPFVDRQLLRAAGIAGAGPLPPASVCYVWDSRLKPGSRLASPFTTRIRYLVLHGPEAPLHAWHSERRDLAADFLSLFGDEAQAVPPLVGIAVGADADNTRDHSVAYVADLDLR